MELIKSQRGGDKLCLEGYMYVKKNAKKDWIRWQCVKQRSCGCKGAVTTNQEVTDVRSLTIHNHEAESAKVDVCKIRSSIKERARMSTVRPSHILSQALLNTTDDIRANIGNLHSIKRDIRRQKRGTLPKDPASLADFVLEDEWKTTGGVNPTPFLIHDGNPAGRNRVTVFANRRALQLLSQSRTWFMDGTFSTAPRIYAQLYIIRVPLGTSAVSCVYALLSGKCQSIYEELLQAVVDTCAELQLYPDPETIVTDFEKAIIQAVASVMGSHVQTQGCFYHLTQSTWRKTQELGLANLYRENPAVKKFICMIDGLAFLPVENVPDGMRYLRDTVPEEVPELEELLDYFDATYVSGTCRRVQTAPGAPIRVRRQLPQFPPSLWNVRKANLEDRARTNNFCEAWNYGFQQLVGHSHPSVWTLIDCLRKDQATVLTQILQNERGQPPQKRQKRATHQLQTRLLNLCQTHAAGSQTIPEFLQAVAYSIRLA